MTKTVSVSEAQAQLQDLLALTRNGNEVIIEENGEPLARLVPIEKPKEQKQRIAGLGKGTMWMSEDFDDDLPDKFWDLIKNYEFTARFAYLHLVA